MQKNFEINIEQQDFVTHVQTLTWGLELELLGFLIAL